jgi:3-phosphoshikimate 1-carboxyvinyltransferase
MFSDDPEPSEPIEVLAGGPRVAAGPIGDRSCGDRPSNAENGAVHPPLGVLVAIERVIDRRYPLGRSGLSHAQGYVEARYKSCFEELFPDHGGWRPVIAAFGTRYAHRGPSHRAGMEITVSRSAVSGSARAPPSKSYTHRAILAAGYSEGRTAVRRPLLSADTRATARAVRAFGGGVEREETARNAGEIGDDNDDDANGGASSDGAPVLLVDGFGGAPGVPEDVLDCANSGTTMRLVTATAALCPGLVVLTGDDSLRSRPQGLLLEAIDDLGGRAESTRGNGRAPLVVGGERVSAAAGTGGKTGTGTEVRPTTEPDGEPNPIGRAPITGGAVSIPGDVSSQFVSALLMAGAASEEGIGIELATALKSAPYVEITREVLRDFGIATERTDEGFAVPGRQSYRPANGEYTVPGDLSSASYLLTAGALAAEDRVTVEGVYPSAQGDSAIVGVLDRMGAAISWDRDAGTVEVGESELSGLAVDVSDTPDLLPTIAVLGAAAAGETRIENCEHVRYKETDRVAAMAAELEALGVSVIEERDRLTIDGGNSELRGAGVSGHADHRIVMALSVCGLIADGRTTVTDAEHVEVSFPDFFEALAGIGADVGSPDAGDRE